MNTGKVSLGGFVDKILSKPTPVDLAIRSFNKSLRKGLEFRKEDRNSELPKGMDTEALLETMIEGSGRDVADLCNKVLEIGQKMSSKEKPFLGVKALVALYAANIRGEKINLLYTACGRNPADFLALVLAVYDKVQIPFGDGSNSMVITLKDLMRVADHKSDTGGVFRIVVDPSKPENSVTLENVTSEMQKRYLWPSPYTLTVPRTTSRIPLHSVKPSEKLGE